MANKYELSEPARNDLKEIWTYLAERNPTSADKLLREFAKKFQLIAENPKMGKEENDLVINLRSFPFKTYVFLYFPIENGVEIYRIFHSARDIDTLIEDFFEGLKP